MGYFGGVLLAGVFFEGRGGYSGLFIYLLGWFLYYARRQLNVEVLSVYFCCAKNDFDVRFENGIFFVDILGSFRFLLWCFAGGLYLNAHCTCQEGIC